MRWAKMYHNTKGKTQASRQECIAVFDLEILLARELTDNEVDTYYRCCSVLDFKFLTRALPRKGMFTSECACCVVLAVVPGY
jgi:hypothetical protein